MSDLVDELLAAASGELGYADKERLFLPFLVERLRRHGEACAPFGRFLKATGFGASAPNTLADLPALPVRAFKQHRLVSCDEAQVTTELRSSSTTGQSPSRIFLDRESVHRQRRALASVLKGHLGAQRRPYLVLDTPAAADGAAGALGARGAAIRGFEAFASQTTYAFDGPPTAPVLDLERLRAFAAAHAGEEVLVFGFTFLIWTAVVEELQRQGLHLGLSRAVLLHGGGWKKLAARQVSRVLFNEGAAAWLGVPASRVLDYYGMVEQVGSVFVDCEHGHKHAPSFATVRVVRALDLTPVRPQEEGLIVAVSLLPSSYPGNVLLTEDRARLVAVDDCPCGRRDVAFVFTSRIERAEPRGCGDVLAEGSAQ